MAADIPSSPPLWGDGVAGGVTGFEAADFSPPEDVFFFATCCFFFDDGFFGAMTTTGGNADADDPEPDCAGWLVEAGGDACCV